LNVIVGVEKQLELITFLAATLRVVIIFIAMDCDHNVACSEKNYSHHKEIIAPYVESHSQQLLRLIMIIAVAHRKRCA